MPGGRPPDRDRLNAIGRLNALLGALDPVEAETWRKRLIGMTTLELTEMVDRLEAGVASAVAAAQAAATAKPVPDPDDYPRITRGPQPHLFVDDGNGSCVVCQLPARNQRHVDAAAAHQFPCTPTTCHCTPATPEYVEKKMAEIRAALAAKRGQPYVPSEPY